LNENEIKAHYAEQAKQLGLSKQSTMLDIITRDKEVETILTCLSGIEGQKKILEIGCGNGYTAEQIRNYCFKIDAIDFSPDLLEVAHKRKLKYVRFQLGDARDLQFPSQSFNVAISERCLINLTSWEDQQKALLEIWRVLKTDGVFLMLEAFTDGLDNLNNARESVGLSKIPQPPFNIYFDKEKLGEFLADKFVPLYRKDPYPPFEKNFLSTYYFGSRVLYPALAKANGVDVKYNSQFVQFFKDLPPYGNYSFIQALALRKLS